MLVTLPERIFREDLVLYLQFLFEYVTLIFLAWMLVCLYIIKHLITLSNNIITDFSLEALSKHS